MNNTISDIDTDLTAVSEVEGNAVQAEAQPAQNESDETYAQAVQEKLALARSRANCRYIPKSRRKPSRKLFRNEFSNKNSVKLTDFFVDFNSVRMI